MLVLWTVYEGKPLIASAAELSTSFFEVYLLLENCSKCLLFAMAIMQLHNFRNAPQNSVSIEKIIVITFSLLIRSKSAFSLNIMVCGLCVYVKFCLFAQYDLYEPKPFWFGFSRLWTLAQFVNISCFAVWSVFL